METVVEKIGEMNLKDVVCDQHGTPMQFGCVQIGHGFITSSLQGWKCMEPGCERFYGINFDRTQAGYADIDGQNGNDDLVNFRTGPSCEAGHPAVGMSLQLRDGSRQWVCGVCEAANAA